MSIDPVGTVFAMRCWRLRARCYGIITTQGRGLRQRPNRGATETQRSESISEHEGVLLIHVRRFGQQVRTRRC
jgi:hypothetical protein